MVQYCKDHLPHPVKPEDFKGEDMGNGGGGEKWGLHLGEADAQALSQMLTRL